MFRKINIILLACLIYGMSSYAQQSIPATYQQQLKMAKDDYTKALIYHQLAKDQLYQNNAQAEEYAYIAQAMIKGNQEHASLGLEIATTLLQIKNFQQENLSRATNWLWYVLAFLVLGTLLLCFYFLRKQKGLKKQFEQRLHLAKLESDVLKAELQAYTNQLKQTQQTIDQFAQINIQDLKSPLQDINNFMNLVEKKLEHTPSEEVREYINTATSNVKQLHQLLTDMVAFSQINSQAGSLERVNLNESIFKSIEKLALEIQKKNAVIACAELPVISTYQKHIQQLFEQIISNGLKYNESRQPKLEIKHRQEVNEHIFSISDNGIGIPEAYQEQAFQVFKKVHNHKAIPGSGIGLAACKKIVDHLNGKIWYTSQVNKGTTFFVSIPVQKENESPQVINYNMN